MLLHEPEELKVPVSETKAEAWSAHRDLRRRWPMPWRDQPGAAHKPEDAIHVGVSKDYGRSTAAVKFRKP